MPDVLDAPLVATTFDDGYAPTSRRTPHLQFRSLTTLSPWHWEVGSGPGPMSGGVEVSARGGLRLATTHSSYSTATATTAAALDERRGTAASASLLHHHHRYLTHNHHLHHPRSHLSTLENFSAAHHRAHLPLHARAGKSVTSAAVGSSGRYGVPLPVDTTMRANERWVLLNKETFQEIFDATLHQMTGELISPDDRKSGDAEAPPSPTTPEGHLTLRMHTTKQSDVLTTASRCHRKRSLSDGADDDDEPEVVSAASLRLRTAMAPLESAKTMASSSALSDITNDRPGHRFSPAMSTTSSSSTSSTSDLSSPRVTSPNTIVTSPQSPLNHQLLVTSALIPDRENNEPLDLSNKRSPGCSDSNNTTQTNIDWCPRPAGSPKCTPTTEPGEVLVEHPPASPMAQRRGSGGSSPGLAPGCSAAANQPTQPPECRQKNTPGGETVRADVRSALGDPRAPSPCGREAGGGGGRAGVAAANGGLARSGEGEENARGAPATTHPVATAHRGGESSSSSSGSCSGGSTASSATSSALHHHSQSGGGNGAGSSSSSTSTTTASNTSVYQRNSKTPVSDNNYTAHHRDSARSPTPHPQTAQRGSGMITNTSGGPAAGGGRLVASPTMRSAPAAGQENWVPLSKARVYDLVEEVMISLGEKQQREERAALEERRQQVGSGGGVTGRDSHLHHQHHHHHNHRATTTNNTQSVKVPKMPTTTAASSTGSNNNNNTLKRSHSSLEVLVVDSGSSGGTARRQQPSQKYSPPTTIERGAASTSRQGHQGQEDGPRGQDEGKPGGLVVSDSSRSVVNTPRPNSAISTKSQLRDHLSARSNIQGGIACRPHHPGTPPSDLKAMQEEFSKSSSQQERSHNTASNNSRGTPPAHLPAAGISGDQELQFSSSSSASPTSKAKQQQCWVALNKMVVFNIVDSAMRNSETEDEEEEEGGSDNEPSDPRSGVSRRTGEVMGDSDSDSSRYGGTLNVEERESWNHTQRVQGPDCGTAANCSNNTQHKANKRHCDTMEAGSGPLKEGESAAKRCRAPGRSDREGTTPPPAHPDPASPRRGSVAEGQTEGPAPTPSSTHPTTGVYAATARRTHCLEGLLSEPGRVRSPRHTTHNLPPSDTTLEIESHHPEPTPAFFGSKVRKGAHLADGQPGLQGINAAGSSGAGENKRPKEATSGRRSPHATSSSNTTPTNSAPAAHAIHESSSGVLNPVSSAVSGRGASPASTMDVTATQHRLLPVSKHGLVPVSPSPSDARSSPRLGWVAVSKIDVHNIVDSVVDSMIVGADMVTSSSSTSPRDDVSATSPVPSSPPSSTSPLPERLSGLTSRVLGQDAKTCHHAGSPPQRPSSETRQQATPRNPEPEVDQSTIGRGTPSPVPASPGSPRSPGDATDRCGDAKSTKAFKWKSSLLMRVEEEKIDVTPEVTTPATSGGRCPQVRTGSAKQREQKSESRSLRSGKRAPRKSVNNSSSKLK